MADVLISHGPPPAPESLLSRLDQIDLRLRQLEEQRRPASAHADDCDVDSRAPARHQHTKSLPSALQLRGTLMDRLNLLESRIRQLSCELDMDAAATAGSSSSSSVAPRPTPVEDRAWWWSESAPMLEPCRDPSLMTMRAPDNKSSPAVAADESWSAVEILQKGSRQLHRDKPNPSNNMVKSLKEAKCACQTEKKKKKKAEERDRTNRRWFGVGC